MFVNADRNDPPFGSSRDVAGVVIFVGAFLLQVVADFQKDGFRANPANRGRVCDAGVWSWSRHPNFFGEIMMWWGMFILCSPVFDAAGTWGYATIISPLLTFIILMFGSGMPTAEGDNQKRFLKTRKQKEAFLQYRACTSPLVPLPPALYGRLPKPVKQWLLFELPMYETDWTYCGEDHDATSAAAAGTAPSSSSSSSSGGISGGSKGSTASGSAGGANAVALMADAQSSDFAAAATSVNPIGRAAV